MPTTTDIHPTLRQALVKILIPHMTTQQERQANLHLALPNAAYRKIDFQGAADVFTANLVDTLLQYGEDAQGKQTIIAVLDLLHDGVGADRQREINQLRQKLETHFKVTVQTPTQSNRSRYMIIPRWIMIVILVVVVGASVEHFEIYTQFGIQPVFVVTLIIQTNRVPLPTSTSVSPSDILPTSTQAVACTLPVAAAFQALWNQAAMGCALRPVQVVWASWTPFERGSMMWRRDTNTIYVFYDNGQWWSTPDEWDGVSELPSRGAPPFGTQPPVRGTGWVWGNDDAVFHGLGRVTDRQQGFCAAVQTFEQGFLLQSSTVEFCHEEQLYNSAREATFGVLTLQVQNAGYWQR